jgi:hypothetical protein
VGVLQQRPGIGADALVHLALERVEVRVNAILQVDAQRGRADVQVLVQRHAGSFEYFFDVKSHGG